MYGSYRWYFPVLLLVFCMSCYKATFVRNVPPQGKLQSKIVVFFLYGLVGERVLDVKQFCLKGDVRQIRTGANFGTSLVTVFSLGLIAPRKIWVRCASSTSASLTPDVEIFLDPKDKPLAAILKEEDGTREFGKIHSGNQEGEWVFDLLKTEPIQ